MRSRNGCASRFRPRRRDGASGRFLPGFYAIGKIPYAFLTRANLEWQPFPEGSRYGRFVSAVIDRTDRLDGRLPAPLRAAGGQAVIVFFVVATMALTLAGLYFALCKTGAKR